MDVSSDFLCFKGRSGDNFVIPSLIQFLSLLNKSGSLTFSLSEDATAYMYMYEGNLTHTELNKLGGIDVVAHMFCWGYGKGHFEFKSDYTGDKLLYKSLGKLVPQQILMRVMQRTDECPMKENIQTYFKDINAKVSLNLENVTDSDREDPIKKKMIKRLEEIDTVVLSTLLSDMYASEMDSCKAFNDLISRGIVSNAENWDKPLPPKCLLDVLNIISKYTDQSIALKFLADKKESLELTSDKDVTIRKLNKAKILAVEDFTKLLPQAKTRWQEMSTNIATYINSLNV